jgi:sugar lactone lactonase YvrE
MRSDSGHECERACVMIFGQGDFKFEAVDGWGLDVPEEVAYCDAPWIACDHEGNVYVLTRSRRGVVVYDSAGKYRTAWAEDVFQNAHGIVLMPEDELWCTDERARQIVVFSLTGQVLRRMEGVALSRTGDKAKPLFGRPTQVSRSPDGDIYVSDGYGGNARIHRLYPNGELIQSWGTPGRGPGEFNLPHSVWCHGDGRLYVADRENDRIQIFSADGHFLGEWRDIPRPSAIVIVDDVAYVSSLWSRPGAASHGRMMTLEAPSQVLICDLDGRVITRLGAEDPLAEGGLINAHSLCVDSRGDIYVGQNTFHNLKDDYRPTRDKVKKFVRR